MGTCNYISQADFDLYTIEYNVDEEYIKEYEEINECEFDEEWDSQIFYEDIYREAERLANKLNEELIFYQIDIKDGYYCGLQTIIKGTDWNDYYFDMCRSKALRKHQAEINKINRKLLPLFEKELGFDHIRCIGVFSNGEAIYERVA